MNNNTTPNTTTTDIYADIRNTPTAYDAPRPSHEVDDFFTRGYWSTTIQGTEMVGMSLAPMDSIHLIV